MPFNVTPTPRTGQGPFGLVPGTIDLPDPAGDLAARIPGLDQINSSIAAGLLARSRGQLSPATLAALQDSNAAWAVGSGMSATNPGGITTNRLARNIGLTAEDQARKAVEDYGSFTTNVSNTQTVKPETEIDLAARNAAYLAAPDPAAAASYAEQLYQKYLRGMSGGGGGGGPQGGTYRPIQRDTGGGGPTSLSSTGTGTYYGGVLREPESVSGGGGGGYGYYGGGGGDGSYSASGTGYYAGMGEDDLYNYFGLTSNDMSGLGLTEGDIYGGGGGGGYDYSNDYLGGGEDVGDVGYNLGF